MYPFRAISTLLAPVAATWALMLLAAMASQLQVGSVAAQTPLPEWLTDLRLQRLTPAQFGTGARRIAAVLDSFDDATSSSGGTSGSLAADTKFFVEQQQDGSATSVLASWLLRSSFERGHSEGQCAGPQRNAETQNVQVQPGKLCLLRGAFVGITAQRGIFVATRSGAPGAIAVPSADFVDVACTSEYAMAVRADGQLYVWGNLTSLPMQAPAQRDAPSVVPASLFGGRAIAKVAASQDAPGALVLARDGTAFVVGTMSEADATKPIVKQVQSSSQIDAAGAVLATNGQDLYAAFSRTSLQYQRWNAKTDSIIAVQETVIPVDLQGKSIASISGVLSAAPSDGNGVAGFVVVVSQAHPLNSTRVLWHRQGDTNSYDAITGRLASEAVNSRFDSARPLHSYSRREGVVLFSSTDGSALYVGNDWLWVQPTLVGAQIGVTALLLLASAPVLVATLLAIVLRIAVPIALNRKMTTRAPIASSRRIDLIASIVLSTVGILLAVYMVVRQISAVDNLVLSNRIGRCQPGVLLVSHYVDYALVLVVIITFLPASIALCVRAGRTSVRKLLMSSTGVLLAIVGPVATEALLLLIALLLFSHGNSRWRDAVFITSQYALELLKCLYVIIGAVLLLETARPQTPSDEEQHVLLRANGDNQM